EEREAGTNPRVADTDGDGILDGDDIYPLKPYTVKKYKKDKWDDFRTYLGYGKYHSKSVLDRFNYNNAIESSFDFEYIESQHQSPVSGMKYGYKYTMEHNGCELIAIYNALKLKGKYQALSEIALEVEINDGMAMDLNLLRTHPNCPNIPDIFSDMGITLLSGYLGSNPFYIRQYLNAHKFKHEQTDSLNELESWVKPGRVFIISYWNDKNDIGRGLHTIATWVDSNGTIRAYNKSGSDNFSKFEEVIDDKNGSFIIGYYLC
ncbi:hypothetical protein, partial [uncultured Clostridium sp.]|uniref:hypothetical protein n=1 Tax=uncultured Clostridium sp. TaxID=59620 RepID=UPI00272E4BB1